MAASSKTMIVDAERRFPVRVRVAVPLGGFGQRLARMHAWLDENCGADGWIIAPSGLHRAVNDAVALYFRDPTAAAAFVARWCARPPPEIIDGAFVMRADDPPPPRAAPLHKAP